MLMARTDVEPEAQAGLSGGFKGMAGAISSGVERHVDIVEVGGSKPPSPTIIGPSRECGTVTGVE